MTGKTLMEELVAGLEGVTPGPWSVDGYSTDAVIYMPVGEDHVSKWRHLTKCGAAGGHWRQNAAHIARCSPDAILSISEYVRTLQEENDRLKREREWLPIETAPAEGKFLAEAKTGDWIVVERYDNPHGFKNTVIDNRNGKWWEPERWMPLPSGKSTEAGS